MRRLIAMIALLSMAACGWAEWPPPGSGPTTAARSSGQPEAEPRPQPAETRSRPQPLQSDSALAVPPVAVETATLPPVPGQMGTVPAPAPGATTPPAAAAVQTRAITTRPGDTIYSLSQRHNVSTQTIIQLNQLTPPYELVAGQRLILPSGDAREHLVGPGDTLYSVSRQYNVDVQALASANGLVAPYPIREGQVLAIPAAAASTTATAAGGAPGEAQVAAAGEVAGDPSGAAAVPPPTADKPPSPSASAERSTTTAGAGANQPPQETKTASSDPAAPLPSPPPVSGKGFIWPLQGKVISSFGTKDKGNKNDGINIAADPGTPVRAAETGVVAYAGNELRGFGNLVLIRHADGWITAYAHNEELLVSRGDTVSKGQAIAKVGRSGGVDQPQLHFQVRQGKKAVDPLTHLPANNT